MNEPLNPIEWKNDALVLLDQTKLPNEIVYEEFTTVEGVWDAIVTMKVRGAPAIGVATAYGVYLGVRDVTSNIEEEVQKHVDYLATSRPTAVNLFWALDRMKAVKSESLKEALLEEAKAIHKEDEAINRAIGENI